MSINPRDAATIDGLSRAEGIRRRNEETLAILRAAAAEKRVAPQAAEIAEGLGLAGRDSVLDAITYLEASGQLRRQINGRWRRVVFPDGQATAWRHDLGAVGDGPEAPAGALRQAQDKGAARTVARIKSDLVAGLGGAREKAARERAALRASAKGWDK